MKQRSRSPREKSRRDGDGRAPLAILLSSRAGTSTKEEGGQEETDGCWGSLALALIASGSVLVYKSCEHKSWLLPLISRLSLSRSHCNRWETKGVRSVGHGHIPHGTCDSGRRWSLASGRGNLPCAPGLRQHRKRITVRVGWGP